MLGCGSIAAAQAPRQHTMPAARHVAFRLQRRVVCVPSAPCSRDRPVARRLWPPCVWRYMLPYMPYPARRTPPPPPPPHSTHPGRSCRLHNATTGAAASGRRSLVHVRDRLLDPPSSSHLGRTSAARRLLGARRPESPPANSTRVPPRHSEPDLQPPRVPGRAAGGGRSTHSGARGWAPPCRARPVEAPPTSLSSRPPHGEAS